MASRADAQYRAFKNLLNNNDFLDHFLPGLEEEMRHDLLKIHPHNAPEGDLRVAVAKWQLAVGIAPSMLLTVAACENAIEDKKKNIASGANAALYTPD